MSAAQPYARPSIIYTGVDGTHMRGAPPAVILRLIRAAMGCPGPLFASRPADSLLCDRGGVWSTGRGVESEMTTIQGRGSGLKQSQMYTIEEKRNDRERRVAGKMRNAAVRTLL